MTSDARASSEAVGVWGAGWGAVVPHTELPGWAGCPGHTSPPELACSPMPGSAPSAFRNKSAEARHAGPRAQTNAQVPARTPSLGSQVARYPQRSDRSSGLEWFHPFSGRSSGARGALTCAALTPVRRSHLCDANDVGTSLLPPAWHCQEPQEAASNTADPGLPWRAVFL